MILASCFCGCKMIIKKSVSINRETIKNLGIALFFFYCMFVDLIEARLGPSFRLILWLGVIFLILFGSHQVMRISNKAAVTAVLISAMFLNNNVGIKNGSYMTTVKFFLFLLIAYLICNSCNDLTKCVKCVIAFGSVHVAATYLFFLLPSLYKYMYRIWGFWPSGTRSGSLGYKAALSSHYSGNGIVLAITYMALFAVLMMGKEKLNKRQMRLAIACFAISFIAVILTSKRAHLLFGLIAILCVYYFSNPKKMKSRTFILALLGGISIPVILFLSTKIPLLNETISRFQDMDDDSHLTNRFSLWEHALQMFKNKPLFGNGWMSFRYDYSIYFYNGQGTQGEYINAHNVYIQLLAEVGIVGFLIYMGIIIYLFYNVFYMIRKCQKNKDARLLLPLYFSAAFMIFYVLYSFTGNCLYDNVQPYFFVVCGIIFGCRRRLNKIRKFGFLNDILVIPLNNQ